MQNLYVHLFSVCVTHLIGMTHSDRNCLREAGLPNKQITLSQINHIYKASFLLARNILLSNIFNCE